MTQSNTEGFVNWATLFTNHTFMFENHSEVYLELDYSPARWDTHNSRGNGWFKIDPQWVARVGYGTNAAKKFSVSATLGAEQEEYDRSWSHALDVGFTWVPNDRMSIDLDMRYKKRNGWLLHTGDRNFATFDADDLQPKLSVDFFITARQQLRLTLQWAGVEARAVDYYRTRLTHGELLDRTSGTRRLPTRTSRCRGSPPRSATGGRSGRCRTCSWSTPGATISPTKMPTTASARCGRTPCATRWRTFLVVKLRYRFGL